MRDASNPWQFAAREPKEFVVLAGCDHNDPKPEAYYLALGRFFDRLGP